MENPIKTWMMTGGMTRESSISCEYCCTFRILSVTLCLQDSPTHVYFLQNASPNSMNQRTDDKCHQAVYRLVFWLQSSKHSFFGLNFETKSDRLLFTRHFPTCHLQLWQIWYYIPLLSYLGIYNDECMSLYMPIQLIFIFHSYPMNVKHIMSYV